MALARPNPIRLQQGNPGMSPDAPSLHRLQRYEEIVPDWDTFVEANHTPEPTTLRIRRAWMGMDELTTRLGDQGFQVEAIRGLPDYLRVVDGPGSVAQTLEHWLGFFHIQQAVMGLPSMALAPRPGERILDLCAAPGGKTAHLAELMGGRGPLVAVDPKEKRLRGLMANLSRMGYANILVIAADGRELPEAASFDRVLVDAPCSAEGNYRKQEGDLPARTASFEHYVTSLQEALLRRAIELTRPGGTIVYSTCTFAPEENEGVVDRVLADAPVQLESIDLPVVHAPGLTSWRGRRFAPEMERAWRVYPQHLDSGGLFMARLRKDEPGGTAPKEGWSPVPAAFPGQDEAAAQERIQGALTLLREEYGFDPSVLAKLGWMARTDNIWVQTADEWPVERWRDHGGWRVVSLGLRAFRDAGGGKETPSNNFVAAFAGALGSGRSRPLDRSELLHLLDGGAIQDPELPAGPVVLLYQGQVLGRGMVGRGGLRHEIPRHQAARLRTILTD